MATFASDAQMLPSQRIGCMPVVIERNGFPLALDVAVAAQFAVGAFVHIIFFMAGITRCRRLVLIEASFVTTVAFRCVVEALQGIRGVAVVVESDELPVFFAVTGFTGLAVPSLVAIVVSVTGRTGCRGLLWSDRRRMAGLAFHYVVGAQ